MSGINPGMIIKVAADITSAVAALGDVVKVEADLYTTTEELNDAYGSLDVAVGTFAANAASALFGLAFDAVKNLGQEIWGVVEAALGLTDAYADFKDAITDGIRESGVLKAGFDALSTAVLNAFGGSREAGIRTAVDLLERGALHALDFGKFLIELGIVGARGIAALIVPVDALLTAIGYLGEKLIAFELSLVDLASQVPGVGSTFDGLAAKGREMQASIAGWKDENYANLKSHQELVSGGGPFVEWAHTATAAIDAAKTAMLNQREAADAAKGSIKELGDANAGLVQGTGEAAVALYTQNEQLAKMDEWSRNIHNKDPFLVLTQGLTRTLPAIEATTAAIKDVGPAVVDMADDVKFAAEVVQKASVSWSEAMDLVRQGQGTMTGQVGRATRPPGMSDAEWALMQNDPRQWELIHGFDWDAPHAGTAGAWSMGGALSSPAGNVQNNSITVNTVAGDKQAIAAVVKDALANDWRSSGMKG